MTCDALDCGRDPALLLLHGISTLATCTSSSLLIEALLLLRCIMCLRYLVLGDDAQLMAGTVARRSLGGIRWRGTLLRIAVIHRWLLNVLWVLLVLTHLSSVRGLRSGLRLGLGLSSLGSPLLRHGLGLLLLLDARGWCLAVSRRL